MSNVQKAKLFHKLHVRGVPLILYNVWDSGSAKAVAKAGAEAIATGSWSVASAHGFDDGEHLPLEFAIANLARIVNATELPVTIDIESGYGKTAEDVGKTVSETIQVGAVGCNLEDSFPEDGKLRDVGMQITRIAQARQIADEAKLPYFINARTDVFLRTPAAEHDEAMLKEAIARSKAYADAGASGLFAPGLVSEKMIAQLAKSSPLPLNVMMSDATPMLSKLADAGVARVSYGPVPYLEAMKVLEAKARDAIGFVNSNR